MSAILEINVKCNKSKYVVYIGENILNRTKQFLYQAESNFSPKYVVLLTSETVYNIYKETINNIILSIINIESTDFIEVIGISSSCPSINKNNHESSCFVFILPDGEMSKSRECKEYIEDKLIEKNVNKAALFIAFGGGVVGDLTGFIASTYYRGTRYIQIPTSLLAMVDSSTGGKTAVSNLPYGKNLIGQFHHPKAVIIDLQFLKSLTPRLIADGMAEVIKIGLTSIPELFFMCETYGPYFSQNGTIPVKNLQEIIYRAIKYKASIVEQDEDDKNLRNILNFGHTFGHAIEAQQDNTLLHGECVSLGIVYELLALRSLDKCSNMIPKRAEHCLAQYQLPTLLPYYPIDSLMKAMKHDKKNSIDEFFQIVFVKDIGVTDNSILYGISEHTCRRVLSPALFVTRPLNIKNNIFITVPGSKSISNRVLLLSALGQGTSKIYNLPPSEDVFVMLNALNCSLNCNISISSDSITIVEGLGWSNKNQIKESDTTDTYRKIWVENGGTVARFLLPVLAKKVCETKGLTLNIDGNKHMRKRPIKDLINTLIKAFPKLNIEYLNNIDCLPIKMSQNDSTEIFPGGILEIKSEISSQFVSAMLMISPFATNKVNLRLIDVKENSTPVSSSYIDMTVELMKIWDIEVKKISNSEYEIYPGIYKNPENYIIEGDASSASYPLAISSIIGSSIKIDNNVKKSLQGDIDFIKFLSLLNIPAYIKDATLCIDEKTSSNLFKNININMNNITDTFMTGAALMAVNGGTLTGVANQRVKECNRIEAMTEILNITGYSAEELYDGIKINPLIHNIKNQNVLINPREDHRLAMSAAVLSVHSESPKIIIPQWRCVEKTYPGFWDMCEQDLGLGVFGIDINTELVASTSSNIIILVGMRNAGKTTLGRLVAKKLNWNFIDTDEEIGDVNQIIQEFGWNKFKDLEQLELKKILENLKLSNSNTIIACGGHVVESDENVKLLLKQKNVVWLKMDEFEILESLSNNLVSMQHDKIDNEISLNSKPKYNEPVESVYARRKELYKKVSRVEFSFPPKNKFSSFTCYLERATDSLSRLFERMINYNNIPIDVIGSKFITLMLPSLNHFMDDPSKLNIEFQDVEAVELRIDALKNPLDFPSQVSLLRAITHKPIIITYRTQEEGSNNECNLCYINDYFLHALRSGAEFIDFQARFREHLVSLQDLTSPSTTLIISQHFINHSVPITDIEIKLDIGSLMKCCRPGKKDIVKIVYRDAITYDSILQLASVAKKFKKNFNQVVIALVLGEKGKLSRVLNDFWTPVLYKDNFNDNTLGQICAQEIIMQRKLLNLPLCTFFLFGDPIEKSLSPDIHNLFFELTNLHIATYNKFSTIKIQSIVDLIDYSCFLGGSITIPLKEKVMKWAISNPDICEIDSCVNVIKAANTMYRMNNKFRLTNTDYLAISKGLILHIKDLNAPLNILIIGTGGTSRAAIYAVKQTLKNATVFIWNRTSEKVDIFKKEFEFIKSYDPASLFHIIIGTIPGDSELLTTFLENIFTKDTSLLIDMAYNPSKTRLINHASLLKKTIVTGKELLLWQATEQSKFFTKAAACFANINFDVQNWDNLESKVYEKLNLTQ